MSTPTNPMMDASQIPTDQATPDQAATPDSTLSDESTVADSVNLHRFFSRLNESLIRLADGSGVHRSATIPHKEGQPMDQHIGEVAQVLSTTGGITGNLLAATHSKFGSDGGQTIAYPAQKLRETIIPTDDEDAKNAIAACRSFVNKAASLIGEDDPGVKLAKSQLEIVGKHNGSGMTLSDLMVALINIPAPVIQACARAHSGTKQDGHSPALRAPKEV